MDQVKHLKGLIEFREARFEAVAQTASDSIIITDDNSYIVFANKKAHEVFGYPQGALIGSDLGKLMPEKHRQGHLAGVQRFILTGSPRLIGHTVEIEGLRRDGVVFPMELSLSCWKEEERYFFSGIIRDITDRKEAIIKFQNQQQELEAAIEELRAAQELLQKANEELEDRVEVRTRELTRSEKEVRRSADELRLVTDAMPVLISYKNSDLVYKFVNKRYEELFGVRREEIIGKHVWDLIGTDAYTLIHPLIERTLKGELIDSEILQLDVNEAGRRWIRFSMIPHSEEGKVMGLFNLIEDVTDLKNVQEELEEKNRDLERANNDLEDFVYTVSHDLRTPVSNIEGLISLLKKSVFNEPKPEDQKILVMMDTSVQKLQKTISDLVEIIKVQKEMDGADEEQLLFEEISREVQDDLYTLIQDNKASISEAFHIDSIKYRRSSLKSILYNLLSNAVKYRSLDRPLEVELKTSFEGGFVVLSVKDNGLGLSQNQQKQLFALFKRMHFHVEGTGIGLFKVKRIVESNGGKIEVESEEGRGTIFNIYLKKLL
ncbi:PAS domain S-box protein [Cesiribacter sp. SM1]|uniref:PAS domain S-box protein n=1 Tax=Cesiribacter sp. SM1 TaxID=2861196 RepID=UPI001CD7A63A|nr:PAS domain S-box protein [Cesiribacter sp. SM1]